jgi:hypothetical protein
LSCSFEGTRSSRVRQYVDLAAEGGIWIGIPSIVVWEEISHSPSFMSTPAG